MAEKQIFCKGCGKYLGEIRDAKLRKGMVYLCQNCETKRLASDMARNKMKAQDPVNDFMNIFGKNFSSNTPNRS